MKIKSDQEIIRLLSNLRNSGAIYPPDLLSARRASFMKHAAQLELVHETAGNSARGGSGKTNILSNPLLETVLVVAIVAEALAASYIYRDKLLNWLQPTPSTPAAVQESAPPSVVELSPTFITVTPIATSTPSPTGTMEITPTFSDNSKVVDVTPNPKDNPGLHLGQTKTPKDNNGKKDKNK